MTTSSHRKKARKESEAPSERRKLSEGSLEASPNSQPLTLERRLKKRESDRKCQRVSRERTKSRITYLESLVEKLSQADDTGKVASLLENVSRLQEERDSLAAKIKSIESILFPAQRPMAAESTKLESTMSSLPEVPSSYFTPVHDMSTAAPAHRTTSEAFKDSPDEGASKSFADQDVASQDLGGVSETSRDLVMHPNFSARSIGRVQYMPLFPPLGKHVCECRYARSVQNQALNFWYQGNTTLSAWMKWPKLVPPVLDDDPFHDDTPVRAIVEGWDAVERRGHVHPMWRLLRTMDEGLFIHADTPQNRLGILYNVSRVLTAHLDTTKRRLRRLPQYWLSRAGAQHCAYATNFVAWPGVRQALDSEEHRFCSNHFWETFINHMRVDWPYELRDCFLFNSSKGLYKISPLFDETLKDIQKIGVSSSFFQHYPELGDAVNVVEGSSQLEGPTQAFQYGRSDVNGLHLVRQQYSEEDNPGSVAAVRNTGLWPTTGTIATLLDSSCSTATESWNPLSSLAEASYISTRDFI
ncbi:hypothetical protein LTR41_008274 [Exophiala xenobiotica]|nr:hypothetical protein LTR41_008274 [Exophiala xenobiotica]